MSDEFVPYDDAVDRFCKLEFGDGWIERIPDEQWNLIQWYIVEKRECTASLKRQADRAFTLRDTMRQQREDAARWLRTHVHIEWSDAERTFGWNDFRSTNVSKTSITGLIKNSELEEALAQRFPNRADVDPRSRKEIIEAYILETKEAKGRPNQPGAENALKAAGKKWSRDEVRETFNELARKHGFAVSRGRAPKSL